MNEDFGWCDVTGLLLHGEGRGYREFRMRDSLHAGTDAVPVSCSRRSIEILERVAVTTRGRKSKKLEAPLGK